MAIFVFYLRMNRPYTFFPASLTALSPRAYPQQISNRRTTNALTRTPMPPNKQHCKLGTREHTLLTAHNIYPYSLFQRRVNGKTRRNDGVLTPASRSSLRRLQEPRDAFTRR